jgi:hypothetical protein
MSTAQIVILLVVLAVIAAAAIVLVIQKRRKKLQIQFGPEYDRAVLETGNRLKAEAELRKRQERVEKYSLRPLSRVDRDRFQQSWRSIQSNFVDSPDRAFADADRLLGQVMASRGYPVAGFDQRAAEISVDHAPVVENYRIAHEIALRHQEGKATTEELRRGMIHYRTLFDDLAGEPLRARAAGLSS